MSPFHSLKSFETQNMLCRNQKRIKSYKELFKLDGFFVEKILFQKSYFKEQKNLLNLKKDFHVKNLLKSFAFMTVMDKTTR